MYRVSPQCSACGAQLVHQSWIALEGECTSVHFVCLALDFQHGVEQARSWMLCCGDILYGGKFGKVLWLLCQDSPLLLTCNRTQAMAVCLSIRYDLERHPQHGPICDSFVLGTSWGCSGCP